MCPYYHSISFAADALRPNRPVLLAVGDCRERFLPPFYAKSRQTMCIRAFPTVYRGEDVVAVKIAAEFSNVEPYRNCDPDMASRIISVTIAMWSSVRRSRGDSVAHDSRRY